MIEKMTALFNAMYRGARPYLTILIATLFNAICAWAALTDKIKIVEYITAVGPTNSMIVGFWFGERAALKQPGSPDEEGAAA